MSSEHIYFLSEIEKIRSFSFYGTKPESALIGIVLLDIIRIANEGSTDKSIKELIEGHFKNSDISLTVEELNNMAQLCQKMSEVPELNTETLDKVYRVLSNSILKNYKKTRILFLTVLLTLTASIFALYFIGDRLLNPRVFKATYFANSTLSGIPFGEYYEAIPAKDWGAGAPKPGLPVNFFSARYESILNLDTETMLTFSTISDDGVRLFVDDEKILDFWLPQDSIKRFVSKTFTPGKHKIRLEYFEAEVGAKLFFEVRDSTGKIPNLTAP